MVKDFVKLNNGVSMPIIGFGTWTLTGKDCEKAVSTALETGYRHIDTASIYNNEEEIGNALKASGIPRKDLFITSKIWNSETKDPEAALRSSLKRLGLKYVDLYLVHWPFEDRLDVWNVFEKLYDEGLCKAIGVSNFTERHLSELLKKSSVVPAVNQVEFSPFLYQKELLDFCNKEKIQLSAYAPLALGKKLGETVVSDIANSHDVSAAQVLLRWGIEKGVVVLPRSSNEIRIKENFDVFDFSLSKEDMEDLDSLNESFRNYPNPEDMA